MTTTTAPLAVGHEIVCYCTKCKMDLGHTIMSMVGGLPSRVVCRTCKSEHNYKKKKGVKDPSAAPKTRAPRASKAEKADKAIPVEMEWMKQMNAATRPMKQYASNEAFLAGDRLSHPSFGDGVVQKVVYPNKVEVIFKTDIKILIHAPKH